MIYVGTCGYAYKDWIGAFYPGTIRSNEMLPYYAHCFRAVEVDASYYGVLPAATVARMNAAAPPAFRFCFKVPKSVTHPAQPSPAGVHPDARAFVESVRPILDAGKFGAALVQFPNSFRPAEGEAYVRRVIEALEPLPLVAEFRNREWQNARTEEMLASLGVGWCNVDMPAYETLMLPGSDVTSNVGYVRFHGRNAAQWWTGDNTTRYEYEYSEAELIPWCDRIAEIDERAAATYAFFNNHARGSAAKNAELLIELLRERYGRAADAVIPASGSVPKQEPLFERPS